ncbi:hypothetical protein [Roseibium aggregatum]|uniref:Uncharacterized protein n=1 Tax=Roseibium aggregatum TaxID=187304 RepID=A0A939EFK5_9HYPH|nr:hypothetical protein [Roseibium aggregatum]MBN9671258.1 hypothetical protein [Roseibium aggregatum]
MADLSCSPDNKNVPTGEALKTKILIFPSIGHDLVLGKKVKVKFTPASGAEGTVSVPEEQCDVIGVTAIECKDVEIDESANGSFNVEIEALFMVGGQQTQMEPDAENAFFVQRIPKV